MSRNPKKFDDAAEETLKDETQAQDEAAPAPDEPEAPPEPPAVAKLYKIVGGPQRITHAGMPMILPMGKVLSDHVANIDELRRQGVLLEEVEQG